MSSLTEPTANAAVPRSGAEQVTLSRLEAQFTWYDRRSRVNRTAYKCFKTATMMAAALIPGLTTFGVHRAGEWSAVLGTLISVLESTQQLNQCYSKWTSYRATAEALEREKFYYLSSSGPYSKVENPLTMLAERVEMLTSQENAKWLSAQSQTPSQKAA